MNLQQIFTRRIALEAALTFCPHMGEEITASWIAELDELNKMEIAELEAIENRRVA